MTCCFQRKFSGRLPQCCGRSAVKEQATLTLKGAVGAYCESLRELGSLAVYYENHRSQVPNLSSTGLDDADLTRDFAIALGPGYIITFNPKLLEMKSLHPTLYETPIQIEDPDTFAGFLEGAAAEAKSTDNSVT